MTKISTDFIRIKGVNSNPKFPKFNSGSLLLDNDKWINVANQVDIKSFQKDNTYAVEIETNAKGYKTIIKNKTIEEDVSVPTKTAPRIEAKLERKTDWEARDRSMMIGGLLHDATNIATASKPGETVANLLVSVKEAVEGLLKIRQDLE